MIVTIMTATIKTKDEMAEMAEMEEISTETDAVITVAGLPAIIIMVRIKLLTFRRKFGFFCKNPIFGHELLRFLSKFFV